VTQFLTHSSENGVGSPVLGPAETTAWNRNPMQSNDLRVRPCDMCQSNDTQLTQLAVMACLAVGKRHKLRFSDRRQGSQV